jgi:hypothetical protein
MVDKEPPEDSATPQLESDIDDPGGRLPPGEAQDRRGPKPPADAKLPEAVPVSEADAADG